MSNDYLYITISQYRQIISNQPTSTHSNIAIIVYEVIMIQIPKLNSVNSMALANPKLLPDFKNLHLTTCTKFMALCCKANFAQFG